MGILHIHVFFLCVNIGFGLIASTGIFGDDFANTSPIGEVLGVPPTNPDGSFMTLPDTPDTMSDLETMQNTSPDENNVFSDLLGIGTMAGQGLTIVFNMISMGFIVNTLTFLGFPALIVVGLETILALFLVLNLYFWITGRSTGLGV